jgi:hypothetical protein
MHSVSRAVAWRPKIMVATARTMAEPGSERAAADSKADEVRLHMNVPNAPSELRGCLSNRPGQRLAVAAHRRIGSGSVGALLDDRFLESFESLPPFRFGQGAEDTHQCLGPDEQIAA